MVPNDPQNVYLYIQTCLLDHEFVLIHLDLIAPYEILCSCAPICISTNFIYHPKDYVYRYRSHNNEGTKPH